MQERLKTPAILRFRIPNMESCCCPEFATQDILIISKIQFLIIRITFHNNNLLHYCKYILPLFLLFLLEPDYYGYILISVLQNQEHILFWLVILLPELMIGVSAVKFSCFFKNFNHPLFSAFPGMLNDRFHMFFTGKLLKIARYIAYIILFSRNY